MIIVMKMSATSKDVEKVSKLGLKAPPLKILAPAALAALAISITCSLLSTEHGPAIT